jgi:hypothetical protein
MQRWYVYAVYQSGVLLYIGKGTRGRYIISARRCNGIAGVLEYFRSEKQAVRRERELIAEFKPPMNKTKGGEGYTGRRYRNEELAEARYWHRQRKEAYENADKYPNYWTYLFAAGWARSDLNSKGIKGDTWQEEARVKAPEDPGVAEALKRLTAWLPLKQPALPPWITS